MESYRNGRREHRLQDITTVVKSSVGLSMMVHTFNPSTWEAEAGGFLNSRPAWVYRVSSRTAKATQRKKKKKKKKERLMKCKLCV